MNVYREAPGSSSSSHSSSWPRPLACARRSLQRFGLEIVDDAHAATCASALRVACTRSQSWQLYRRNMTT
jgi:hypothetical protein